MGEKNREAAIKDNTGRDPCPLNKKGIVYDVRKSGRREIMEGIFISERGIMISKGMGIKVLQCLPVNQI